MKSRIALISALHPAHNPRLVKEANALAEAGYKVDVFACQYMPSAMPADAALLQRGGWRAHFVQYDRETHRSLFWRSRFRQKVAAALWRPMRSCSALAARELALRAIDRVVPELRALVLQHKADFYIAHTVQALPIAVAAAQRHSALAGFDAEDFHSGMNRHHVPPDLTHDLVSFLERKHIRELNHLTAASPGVAAALRRTYPGVNPVSIRNVFPLAQRPDRLPVVSGDGPLRLYWCSQTIGRDRGLEEAVCAMALLPKGSVELHLRGHWQAGYERVLRGLWAENGLPLEKLVSHPPAPPEQLVLAASEFDVGLALEVPVSENRMICMQDLCTNKVFMYLSGGLALAASSLDQEGPVYEGAGFAYRTGHPEKLAAGLRRWLENRAELQAARARAWEMAGREYNWDREKNIFLETVRSTLNSHVRFEKCAAQDPDHPARRPSAAAQARKNYGTAS